MSLYKSNTILFITGLILFMTTCVPKQTPVDDKGITKNQLIMRIKPIQDSSEYNKLTPEEAHVLLNKGTEYAFTGTLLDNKTQGIYVCKQCDAPLYRSEDKFESYCGWPSFDDQLEGAVTQIPDADGRRTEIICSNCKGHLGHVFKGEGFTAKDTRHCVNSISMRFISKEELLKNTDTLSNESL